VGWRRDRCLKVWPMGNYLMQCGGVFCGGDRCPLVLRCFKLNYHRLILKVLQLVMLGPKDCQIPRNKLIVTFKLGYEH
jgi:hypothetical protein